MPISSDEIRNALEDDVRNTKGQYTKITVGDVVQLRSGGPEMTAVQVEGNVVDCFWICDRKQPCNYLLPSEGLVKIR